VVTACGLGGTAVERTRFVGRCYPSSSGVENLAQAVSLHYVHYNFARPHITLTKDASGHATTLATASGVESRVWMTLDIAALTD
jgi:hypothetical protein